LESHNEYHCSNCKWVRRSENRAFFIKRQERKESKSEAHQNNIKEVFIKWSDLHIYQSQKKNPFYTNLYSDIFDTIKSIDINNEAYSHLNSAKDIDYKNTYNNYAKLEQLQKNNNRIIENLVNKLKEKIVINNSDNIIDYIFGQFLYYNLHNISDINSKIEQIKKYHPDVVFHNPEETDIDIPIIDNSCRLSSVEEKTKVNQLIDTELQEIIKQLKNYDARIKEIETELQSFRENCTKIFRDMDIVDLKGICKKEANFKFILKLKKKFKSIKCFRHND
jgi:hypothetical protein